MGIRVGRFFGGSALLLSGALFAGDAPTATPESQALSPAASKPLQPFRAEYRANVSRIPTPIRAELVLEASDQDGVYRMQLSVDSRLMQNTELSIFRWQDCAPRTMHYMHQFEGFRRQRDYFMEFFWEDTPTVTTVSSRDGGEEEIETYDIADDTMDELTMLLAARCLLQDEQENYALTSAYGTRLRTHHITVAGRETLSTPLGDLETIRIEKSRDADSVRRSIFWLAPELDYLLVRARHVETRALFGELRLVDYEGPFTP
ncbi:DUF3108 domain-containing protein [Alcanivorax sp. JB21]|uniref:DUF3108 domain-containing protein n=1 Tax=Alcanivorax limicola TaxID=2874102 RepID=UPI001CC15E9F|nr:DUF3108 domain-containing protein [Alcanivorax limicola]MBZ2188306.1 DUF3108 domain-containing protein [Alcanivorax limicola]